MIKQIILIGLIVWICSPYVFEAATMVHVVGAFGLLVASFEKDYLMTPILFYTFFKCGVDPDCIDMEIDVID